MFRLMIIDDEPWALKGLQGIIPWEAYGFSQVDTYQDPGKALADIPRIMPDAVLSDMRMPGMSGLELMQSCRAQGCDALFAVVSAYAEFEYAKAAMDMGAVSYILKPLEEEAVCALAAKLQQQLLSRRDSTLQHSIRSLVLCSLTDGKTAKPDPVIQKSGLFSLPYRIAFAASVPEGFCHRWVSIYSDLVMLILPADRFSFPQISIGISTRGEKASAAERCIWQALVAYYTQRFYGRSAPLVFTEGKNPCHHLVDAVIRSVSAGDLSGAQAGLTQLETFVRENALPIHEVTFAYNELQKALLRRYPQQELQENLRRFGSCFQMYSVMHSVDVLFAGLRVLIDEQLKAHALCAEEPVGATDRVIQYVDHHFHETLTLEGLASQFNISLAHLSRQFKRATGVPYTEYIKTKRMEKACSLLKNTSLSIAEVGEQVGYPDYFHFSKLFKKVLGVSPTVYRKEGAGHEKT